MIVSIDIGTSYSCISMLGPVGKPVPVDISTGASMFGSKHSLPSAVYLEDNGNILVGQAAMNSRSRKSQNFRMNFKRNLGDKFPLAIGNRSFRVEELYTELLRHMKSCVQKISGEKIEQVYLTHPVSYGKENQDRLLAAAKAAGLFQVELVQEPVAAAMSYCAAGYIKDGQTFLVYDFGGGTFDCALLKYENGNFRILGADGLPNCGGIDMDRLIYQDMMKAVDPDTMQMLRKNETQLLRFNGRLSELTVKVKHQLSNAQSATEYVPMGWDELAYTLEREQFNRMIAPMISQTIQVCRNVLERANIASGDLSAVLMVGGTSRVPLVQDMVRQFAKKVPVRDVPDLELAVVQGALSYRGKTADPEALYQKACKLFDEEKYAEAVALFTKAADQGHPGAQFELGCCYENGNGVSEDEAEAVKWYRKAAEQGHIEAQYELGLYYDCEQEYTEAIKWYTLAAEQDYKNAQASLGDCFYFGWGTDENYQKAAYWYRKAAEQGHVDAQNSLGRCYEYGQGLTKNGSEAAKWYCKAAEQGDADAQWRLGFCYERGYGISKNLTEAVKWYRKAAEQGDSKAPTSLGLCYEYGQGVKPNLTEAVKWYRKGAELGNVVGQLYLGLCYDLGKGVEKSASEAAKWYRKAAEQGDADAQYRLGLNYDCKQEYAEAIKWYTLAAEQNHMNAQANLGACFYFGWGTDKNHQKAVYWYRKAAEQGHAEAQYSLGLCYEHGEGVPKNLSEAVKWYHKAAEQGDAAAQFSLGQCYYKGEGVSPDSREAVKWFTKAAEQGNADAQYALGICYNLGKGISCNQKLAVDWFRKASAQGHAKAQYNLGVAYEYGNGVEKNPREAAERYRAAAGQGLAAAQWALGICYRNGMGVKQSYTEAVSWFQKAADQGDANGQFELAFCYDNGRGIRLDHYKAVNLYRMAAEQGNVSAQYNLGVSYEIGEGTEKNLQKAVYWYRKAADQGLEEAKESLKKIEANRWKDRIPATVAAELKKAGISKGEGQYAESKLSVLKYYLGVPNEDTILLAHDATMMRSGKNGFILTNQGIYSRQMIGSPVFVPWDRFMMEYLTVYPDKEPELGKANERIIYANTFDTIRQLNPFFINLQNAFRKQAGVE